MAGTIIHCTCHYSENYSTLNRYRDHAKTPASWSSPNNAGFCLDIKYQFVLISLFSTCIRTSKTGWSPGVTDGCDGKNRPTTYLILRRHRVLLLFSCPCCDKIVLMKYTYCIVYDAFESILCADNYNTTAMRLTD